MYRAIGRLYERYPEHTFKIYMVYLGKEFAYYSKYHFIVTLKSLQNYFTSLSIPQVRKLHWNYFMRKCRIFIDNSSYAKSHQPNELVIKISKMIRKTKKEEATSKLAVMGYYVLTPEIFEILEIQEAKAMKKSS
ncbi:UTP-glucose-1-phosphate uridylyltransferase [Turicibacter sanguinis]|nr:UTP-glucose-1-phosphate uridylyltransferase [Turicibacter sanguinis]